MDESIPQRWAEFRNLPNHPEMSVFPDRPPRIHHQDVKDGFEFECPKCKYNLTGTSGRYCPECGIDLEYEPVTVFTAADQSLVWAAALVLDRWEISNLIIIGSFDPFGGFFRKKGGLPHVMVPFKFFHEAVAALLEEFGGLEFKAGERPAVRREDPDWICSNCGNENPCSFEVCWSCSAERTSR